MLFAFQSKIEASCNLGVLATFLHKDGLISKDVFTFVSLVQNHSSEQIFRISCFGVWCLFFAQESDLAPFVGNGTKAKIPSVIKLPLSQSHFFMTVIG